MKRLGSLLLIGTALLAQTGCDDDGFSIDLGYFGVPSYGYGGYDVYYERPYVTEYWVEETYYEEAWYEDVWYDTWFSW